MVHEAGHAVVAQALGADLLFVQIDISTSDGGARASIFDDDRSKALQSALRVAGQSMLSTARAPRKTKQGDFRKMRQLLSRVPEAARRAARAEGYRLADAILKEKATTVENVVDVLMAGRWKNDTDMVRIERDELLDR